MSDEIDPHGARVAASVVGPVHEPPTRDVLYHRTKPCNLLPAGGCVRVELSCGHFEHTFNVPALMHKAVARIACGTCAHFASERARDAQNAAAPEPKP